MNQKANSKRNVEIGVIFSEDENDAQALKHIIQAVWAEVPRIDYCRKPLILVRDQAKAEERKKNAADVLATVRAKSVLNRVRFVVAHQDCDDFEPAHETLSNRIKNELIRAGVENVVAVTPAWEIEAWWFLWPDAVAAVNRKWNRLVRTGNHGMIKDAKERLRRDLRTNATRDYVESDSRAIAERVKTMGLINVRIGVANSLSKFVSEIIELKSNLSVARAAS